MMRQSLRQTKSMLFMSVRIQRGCFAFMFNCAPSKKTLAVILHIKITLILLVIPLSGESVLRSEDAALQYDQSFTELSSDHL